MKIELEELLINNLKHGINLFTGAGFSLEAKNFSGERIPLGNELSIDLANKFKVPQLDLPKVSTIIESKYKEEFYDYLRSKYNVKEFDIKYRNLELVNIKNIYTTNIDNLIFKIFEGSNRHYIYDTSIYGPSFKDKKAINYYPLHGSILNKEKPMTFTSLAISSAYSSSPKLWGDLERSIEAYPTIFWGYSLNDSGVLETLNSIKMNGVEKNQKWVVLRKEKPDEEEYFRSLGFNIIIGTNIELLDYFKNTLISDIEKKSIKGKKTTKELFGEEFVPSNPNNVPVREINEFYLGLAPTWSDIFRPDLYKTTYFKIIQNTIFSKKSSIVIGIPGSGKSTLLMQLAAYTDFDGYKIILENPTIERAKTILNCIGTENAIVFIDNFTEEVSSFLLFHNKQNIKLLGFDREHNFEIISHIINRNEFNITSVTSLSPVDFQEIYSRIPLSIKSRQLVLRANESDEAPSLFEFLNLNLNIPKINNRYNSLLKKLEEENEVLTDFLVLICYVHFARTPLSFDMTYSFFSNDISSYKEIYEMKETLGKLLVNAPVSLIDDDSQDYFSTRSVILSEVIMEEVDNYVLARVLNKFVDNLPPYNIVNYKTFRKRAYDKYILIRAFPNWKEGKAYIEKLMINDPYNPFLLQQGALYLSHKQKHNDAFYWIDKARNMINDTYLSIRNSHAIILFEANIKREGADVRNSLDKSMEILTNCYSEDKRKLYHALKFAQQSIYYFNRYGDSKSLEYLNQSKKWIEEELKTNGWHRGLRNLFREVCQKIK